MSDEREIGRMQADIENLTKAVERLTVKVETLTETMAKARGGWAVISVVATLSGAAGSLLTLLLKWKTGA